LATFDLMFEGIRTTLKSQIQSAIRTAEGHLEDAFALRVLKALFLVKYVKGFKTTPRNLRVLLHESFDQDFEALRKNIAEALSLLEQQTYIQRNGDEYEFLTDEEKDVEQEIKNTEVDSGEVARTLEDILFTDIVRDRKMRYDVTKQDFAFTKKLDDRLSGREQELAIHFVTPFYEHHDQLNLLKANALGRAELTIVLPSDARLVSDLLLHERTKKYIRLNQATAQQETVRRILSDKGFQNQTRLKALRDHIYALVSRARLLVSGEEIEMASEDPRTRVMQGFNELVVRVYPHLRMLQGILYSENDISKYLQITRDSLFGGEAVYSEAEGGANKTLYDEASLFMQTQSPNFAVIDGEKSGRLQAILNDPHVYKGERMREAKALMDELNTAIQTLVESERAAALQAVAHLQAQLHGMDEFPGLTEAQQKTLDENFEAFPRVLARQFLIPVIRDARRRLEQETYTQLLTQMSNWAKPPTTGEPGVREPKVEYVTRQALQVAFKKGYLENGTDVDAYLAKLKAAMLEAIAEGKRIQI